VNTRGQTEGPLENETLLRGAESYATETCNADLQRVWKLLTPRLAPGSLILDLGCGAGRDLAYFAKAGFRVVALDYSLLSTKGSAADGPHTAKGVPVWSANERAM